MSKLDYSKYVNYAMADIETYRTMVEKWEQKWEHIMPSLRGDFKPIITSTPKTMSDKYAKNRDKLTELIIEKGFTIDEQSSTDDLLYFNLGGYHYGAELFDIENYFRYFLVSIDKVKVDDYFYDDYDWTGNLKEFKDFLFDAMCFKWKYIKTMHDEYVTLRNKHKNHPDDGVFDKIVNNIEHDDDDEEIRF